MHRGCYTAAVKQGYFAKVEPAKHQFPVVCSSELYHFVLGNLKEAEQDA